MEILFFKTVLFSSLHNESNDSAAEAASVDTLIPFHFPPTIVPSSSGASPSASSGFRGHGFYEHRQAEAGGKLPDGHSGHHHRNSSSSLSSSRTINCSPHSGSCHDCGRHSSQCLFFVCGKFESLGACSRLLKFPVQVEPRIVWTEVGQVERWLRWPLRPIPIRLDGPFSRCNVIWPRNVSCLDCCLEGY